MPLGIDPIIAAEQAEREEENDRTPSAIIPEHKRYWPTTPLTEGFITPNNPPLKAKATDQTALSQQMQAEVVEENPQGRITDLLKDPMGRA